MTPSGHKCFHLPRNRRVGVALVFRAGMSIVVRQRSVFFDSFECLEVTLTSGSVAHLSIIYRPPPSRANQSSDGIFLKDFASFLDGHTDTKHLLSHRKFWQRFLVILMFRDVPSHPTMAHLHRMLEDSNLVQHVTSATHIAGHTLDYVITRTADDIIVPGTVTVTTLFSDHHAVEFEIRLSKPDAVKQQIHYRQLRRINHTQLRRDLEQLWVVTHPAVSLTTLVKQYNVTDLSELLERHTPLTSRFLTLRSFSAWYDADLIAAKQKRRRSELRWRRSRLTVH